MLGLNTLEEQLKSFVCNAHVALSTNKCLRKKCFVFLTALSEFKKSKSWVFYKNFSSFQLIRVLADKQNLLKGFNRKTITVALFGILDKKCQF